MSSYSDTDCPAATACPSSAQLQALAAGTLDAESDFLSLASHVDQCVACSRALEALDAADPITIALRREPVSTLAASLAECRARLRSWWDLDDPLQPPCQIDDYEVLERIGHGGWGLVYRARHARHGEVALKLLRAELAHSERHRQRFLRESQALALLDDPRIVRVLDQGTLADRPYVATRFILGTDLRRLLTSGRVPSVVEACRWIQQAAEILQLLHERGLVHRDIKPSNIMLAEDGQIHLLDFGLARLPEREDQTSLTGEGDVFGTLEYMAPEALADTGQADIRSDLFSLGRTLDQLLRGRTPPRLQKIIDRLHRSDPSQRFQTPAALAAALAPFTTRHPHRRRQRRLAAAVGLTVLLAIALWVAATRLSARVLFADSFNDPQQSLLNWYVGLPDIKPTMPQAAVDFVDGQARLRNRGSLVSYEHFPTPYALKLKWKWTKGQATYCDVLSLGLRTSGGLHDRWPFELGQGLLINFNPSLGEVQFIDLQHAEEVNLVRRGVALPKHQWCDIRIIDDGQRISIYLDDSSEPILSGPAPHPSRYYRIAIYNREPVAGIEKESFLDDIRIEALP